MVKYNLIVLLVATLNHLSLSVVPPTTKPRAEECTSVIGTLEDVFVEFIVSYFVDNPRGTNAPINPELIKPFTVEKLFQVYYGNGSTTKRFKQALLQIAYSDPGMNREAPVFTDEAVAFNDAIQLREKIYTLAKAGSFDLARENFGLLLYDDFTQEVAGQYWTDHRCFESMMIVDAKHVINYELAKLRNEIGDAKLAQFLSVGSGTTLTFVMDDTGSMGGEIEAAKRRAKEIIDTRQGSLDQPQDFVLVPFNDPSVGPLTATTDANKFKDAINALHPHGGGDAPELAMRGIQLAIENSRIGSHVFVITDVDAKDVELQDNVVAQAKEKNIKVTFLLTNRVSNNICRRTFSRFGRPTSSRCSNPSYKFGLELYEYIATSTGGKVLIVGKNDIFSATEVIDTSIRQGVVSLVNRIFKSGLHTADVNVDSTLQGAIFIEATSCGKISITKDDEEVALTQTVSVETFREYKFDTNKSFGKYVLSVQSNSNDCQVKISSRSTIGITQSLARMVGRRGAEELVTYYGQQPLDRDDVTLIVDKFGDWSGSSISKIEVIDMSTGEIVQSQGFTGQVESLRLPLKANANKKLVAVAYGTDSNGNPLQRIDDTVIEFVDVGIDCSDIEQSVFRAGDVLNVKIRVTNFGKTKETFGIGASDDKNFVKSVSATSLAVLGVDSATFNIKLEANKNAVVGTSSVITITAKRGSRNQLIFKQCRIVIGQKAVPEIESFNIVTNINSRFAETSVTSTVLNDADISRNAVFNVIMPLDAFITKFSMTIDGKTYDGKIEEKEKAQRIIEIAKATGKTAGHVAAREESTTTFITDVNLEARKRVVFNLKYQQLLRRSNGSYVHETNVQTKQPVGSLSIDVYICETRKIVGLQAVGFDSDQTVAPGPQPIEGVVVETTGMTGHVSFNPTKGQQLQFSPVGLNGKFIVKYDVERKVGGKYKSEVVSDGGFFTHFIAPSEEAMPKRVLFLFDLSGSMFGRKIEQLRNAARQIFNSLSVEDEFGLVIFNSNVSAWLPDSTDPNTLMVPVTTENIDDSLAFLNAISPKGGTNMEQGIIQAIYALGNHTGVVTSEDALVNPIANYIVFLTDGTPTEGIINPTQLIEKVDQVNGQRFGIHTIGFGSLVDAGSLAKLASRNKGTSKQIFEDIDADLQISNFFSGIAHPMLRDVTITYRSDQVKRSSDVTFDVLYVGTEAIISGEFLQAGFQDNIARRRKRAIVMKFMGFEMSGKGKNDKNFFLEEEVEVINPHTHCTDLQRQIPDFSKRLSTFMDLKFLVEKMRSELNQTIAAEIKEEALNKSLEYGFVTPGITSMIVLKPDDLKKIEEQIAAEDAEKKEEDEKVKPTEGTMPKINETFPVSGREIGAPGAASSAASIGDGFKDAGGDAGPALSHIRPPMTTSPPRTVPLLTTTRRVAVFGDPHFVIDIHPQITLCFNWKESSGKLFNLLHDRGTGLSVNGELVSNHIATDQTNRTFISKLSINVPKKKIQLIITPQQLMIVKGIGKGVIFNLDKEQNINRNGINIKVKVIYSHKSEVLVTIAEGIVFRVMATMYDNDNPFNTNHVDFTIIEASGLSSSLDGVLGMFESTDNVNAPVSIEFGKDGNSAILWYRHKAYTVGHQHIKDYNENYMIECWGLNDENHLMQFDRSYFSVNKLSETPNHNKKVAKIVKHNPTKKRTH